MTNASLPTALQHSPLFFGVSSHVLDLAVRLSNMRAFVPGEFLFHQNEPATHFLVLISGRLKHYTLSAAGNPILFRIVPAGCFVGCQAALNRPAKYFATSQAVLQSTALCWTHERAQRLLHASPEVLFNLFAASVGHMQEYQQRLAEMVLRPARQRIAATLVRLLKEIGAPQAGSVILDGFTGRDLAAMAGTSAFTVSRALTTWEQANILERHRLRIVIHAPARLSEIAKANTTGQVIIAGEQRRLCDGAATISPPAEPSGNPRLRSRFSFPRSSSLHSQVTEESK